MYKISIVGLRYIGLSLSMVLQKPYNVVGFDKSKTGMKKFSKKHDRNNEFDKKILPKLNKLETFEKENSIIYGLKEAIQVKKEIQKKLKIIKF
tara:strand:- start:49 stop:327 length:279 start_codon:yes stop_codon:yes gene_type:complete